MLGAMSLNSCKKDYQCKYSADVLGAEVSTTDDFTDLTKSEAEDKKDDCVDGGGEWSTK